MNHPTDVLALAILLLALTPAAPLAAGQPPLTLRPASAADLEWAAGLGAEEAELAVVLFPRDDGRALLAGCLRAAVGPVRSLVLVTGDGGRTWREPLPAVPAHDVVTVRWSSPDRCLVALQWAVEDPGWELRLFASADAGETWRELAPVRKDGYLDCLRGLAFDGSVGVVAFDPFDEGSPEGPKPPYALATTDGGLTWRRSPAPRILPHAALPDTRGWSCREDGDDLVIERDGAGIVARLPKHHRIGAEPSPALMKTAR